MNLHHSFFSPTRGNVFGSKCLSLFKDCRRSCHDVPNMGNFLNAVKNGSVYNLECGNPVPLGIKNLDFLLGSVG